MGRIIETQVAVAIVCYGNGERSRRNKYTLMQGSRKVTLI